MTGEMANTNPGGFLSERTGDESCFNGPPQAMNMLKHDAVSHPAHYTAGTIECIDAIEAALTPEEYRGYLKGQIFKYNWRLGRKDEPVQEAGKLLWYGERLRKFLGKGK